MPNKKFQKQSGNTTEDVLKHGSDDPDLKPTGKPQPKTDTLPVTINQESKYDSMVRQFGKPYEQYQAKVDSLKATGRAVSRERAIEIGKSTGYIRERGDTLIFVKKDGAEVKRLKS